MKRILLITSVLPWPLRRNGGAQRTALLRDALARHGQVDVLAVGGKMLREETPDFDAKLIQNGVVGCIVRPEIAPRRPWFLPGPLGSVPMTVRKYVRNYEIDAVAAAKLDELMKANKYSLIVSRYLTPALQCGVNRYANVPTILDFDDIDWLTLAAQIAAKPWKGVTGKLAAKRVLARVTGIGQLALQQFSHVFVTCEEDAVLLPRTATVLPNIPFSDSPEWLKPLPPDEASEELLFVGDLQFPPNRDGLDRFLTKVWPLVKVNRANATLSIVGRGLSDADRAKWSQAPGANVIGFADDLAECYRRCAMTVVPIYFGGGTKIKVLESLAFGRAVVTTPQAMRGYAGLAGVSVGADDAAFAAAVVDLLSNPAKRSAMAADGRSAVEKHFSPQQFGLTVENVLTKVLR